MFSKAKGANIEYYYYETEKLENVFKAMQKRPGMYLGSLKNDGVFTIFRLIFREIFLNEKSKVYLTLIDNKFSLKCEHIDFKLIKAPKRNTIGSGVRRGHLSFMYVPLALSFSGRVILKNQLNEICLQQDFENKLLTYEKHLKIESEISSLELEFELDTTLWNKAFPLNIEYLFEKFKEYSLCNKGVFFHLEFYANSTMQKHILCSKDGFKDEVDRVILDKHDKTYLPLSVNTKLDDFSLEFSLAFLSNSVDKPHIKSYVNSLYSIDNGTHVDAVVKGVQEALRTYLKEKKIDDNYTITKKQILRYLILMVQVKMFHPNYAGSVCDKLVTKSIVDPISAYVKKVMLVELHKHDFDELEFLEVFSKNWDLGYGTLKFYQINTFTNKMFKGNPAVVYPLEEWLGDELMQTIAMEHNLSETAFFVKEEDVFHIRWFTPTAEVEMCGHATLASAYVLFEELDFEDETIVFSSKSGLLKVSRENEHYRMNFPIQKLEKCDTPKEILEAFEVEPLACYKAMDYLVIFENEKEVEEAKPNLEQLKKLDASTRGVIVSAKSEEYDFVNRFFAPNVGVDEDPVTGSAFTQLVPYWIEVLGKDTFHAKQVSKRGGEVLCELRGDRVIISGSAVCCLVGKISL